MNASADDLERAMAWARPLFGTGTCRGASPETVLEAWRETTRPRDVMFTWWPFPVQQQHLHRHTFLRWHPEAQPRVTDVFSPEDPHDQRFSAWVASTKRVAPRAVVEGHRARPVERILRNWRGRVSARVAFPVHAFRIGEICFERYVWNGDAPFTVERSGAITLEARSKRLSATFSLDGEVLLRARGTP